MAEDRWEHRRKEGMRRETFTEHPLSSVLGTVISIFVRGKQRFGMNCLSTYSYKSKNLHEVAKSALYRPEWTLHSCHRTHGGGYTVQLGLQKAGTATSLPATS